MPLCKSCGERFPCRVTIEGKLRVVGNRKYCLVCSPFGARNTGLLQNGENVDEKRERRQIERRKRWVVNVSRRRKKVTEMAIAAKGGCCQICGYNRCSNALEFHHLDPAQKSFGIRSTGSTPSWEKLQVELEKCVLLCANCHREVEAGLVTFPLPQTAVP